MRQIERIDLPETVPADISGMPLPMLEWIEVDDLWIDPRYQRDLSAPSLRLIASLIEGWDWLKMAPILVALTENGFEVIDGQNRATAAKLHPQITKVPCYVVDGSSLPERAAAFVSHARDKVLVTRGQVFHAEVAAGDEDALTVQAVCTRAGVRILPFSPPFGTAYQVGDTTALAGIKALVSRRGAMRAREILEALVKADLAPILAAHIRAGEALCCEQEYAAEFGPEQLTNALRALGNNAVPEVKALAAAKCLPAWRAWTAVLFKHRRAKPKSEPNGTPGQSESARSNAKSGPDRVHGNGAYRAPAASGSGPEKPAPFVHVRTGVIPASPGTKHDFGDPPPGRSALDQRIARA